MLALHQYRNAKGPYLPTHLLLRNRVLGQYEVRQPRELAQHLQIRQLGQAVRREHQVRQVGDRSRERRLDARDTVPRQQKGRYPGRQGEVPQGLNIVIGKVDGIVRLPQAFALANLAVGGNAGFAKKTYASNTQVLNRRNSMACSRRKRTFVSTLLFNRSKV